MINAVQIIDQDLTELMVYMILRYLNDVVGLIKLSHQSIVR